MSSQAGENDLTPLQTRYHALKHHRPRLGRSQLLERCALAEHRLDVRDNAYRRLIAVTGHAEQRAELAEGLVNALVAMVRHPSAVDDLEGLRHNVEAHLGSYRRALDESALYHAAMTPDGEL